MECHQSVPLSAHFKSIGEREVSPLNNMAKNLILWVVIAVILLVVFNGLNPAGNTKELTYNEWVQAHDRGEVEGWLFAGH